MVTDRFIEDLEKAGAQAEIERLKAEMELLTRTLVFVERWAVYKRLKADGKRLTAEEAIASIAHHPEIAAITKRHEASGEIDLAAYQRDRAVLTAEQDEEIARLRAREKDLTLEGLSLIGRLEAIREVLAGTDIGCLPSDYPKEKMAQDRMDDIERLKAEVARLKENIDGWKKIPAQVAAQYEPDASEIARLKAEVARKDAALEKAESHFYNMANAINDEDYRGSVPGIDGVVVGHREEYHKGHVERLVKYAEEARAALTPSQEPRT